MNCRCESHKKKVYFAAVKKNHDVVHQGIERWMSKATIYTIRIWNQKVAWWMHHQDVSQHNNSSHLYQRLSLLCIIHPREKIESICGVLCTRRVITLFFYTIPPPSFFAVRGWPCIYVYTLFFVAYTFTSRLSLHLAIYPIYPSNILRQ